MENQYVYSILKMKILIRKQLLIVGCINIGQIVVGYSVGWTAPIIPKLQDPEANPLPELATDVQTSWIGSTIYIGAVIGPHITGVVSNMYGRKPCIMIGGFLNMLAYILVVTTRNISMIYAVRVISGLGMGITIVTNIVYVGEIASTHIRGILLTSIPIFGISGTLMVYAVGSFVSYVATGYIALVVSVAHVVAVGLVVPESPAFYAMTGNSIKAAKTLNLLGRGDDIEEVINNTPKIGESTSKVKNWTEIFTYKCNIKSLLLTFMLGTFQQFSGVAVLLFFATTIFQLAGSSVNPDIATIIIGATRFISSFLAPAFIEKKGRKTLLLISMAACACSLTILGVYFYLERVNSTVLPSIGWLPLVSLIVYFFCFEAGFGTIPNAIVGELFRTNVRANGSALAITLTWCVGFALTSSFATMIDNLGGDVTFWLFGGSCVLGFIFTFFFVPETMGKTLHEIQEMMS